MTNPQQLLGGNITFYEELEAWKWFLKKEIHEAEWEIILAYNPYRLDVFITDKRKYQRIFTYDNIYAETAIKMSVEGVCEDFNITRW